MPVGCWIPDAEEIQEWVWVLHDEEERKKSHGNLAGYGNKVQDKTNSSTKDASGLQEAIDTCVSRHGP